MMGVCGQPNPLPLFFRTISRIVYCSRLSYPSFRRGRRARDGEVELGWSGAQNGIGRLRPIYQNVSSYSLPYNHLYTRPAAAGV